MAEHNLLIYAGDVREKDDAPHVICENLVCYTKDAGKRAQSFERMRRLVDGKAQSGLRHFCSSIKEMYEVENHAGRGQKRHNRIHYMRE